MLDPLSVLGAGLGLTSLIIQLTDGCIRGYAIFRQAANFPKAYDFLLVRLHIEQQRFLNFALEAGALTSDGAVHDALRVHRALLLAVLAEIKTLFDDFAAANGRYEDASTRGRVSALANTTANIDLAGVLSPTALEEAELQKDAQGRSRTSIRSVAGKSIHKVGRRVAKSAKDLRVIATDPRRLVWATLDKALFTELIAKLESLNTFLVSLLDSSQLRSLHASMSKSYLEILQLRNDVSGLKVLIEALAAPVQQHGARAGSRTSEEHAFGPGAAQEAQSQRSNQAQLQHLTLIKIKLTEGLELDEQSAAAVPSTTDVQAPLPLRNFGSSGLSRATDISSRRMRTTYNGQPVWIEWKNASELGAAGDRDDRIERRIGLLTDLLRSSQPDEFGAAPCLGYVKLPDAGGFNSFGIVFKEPFPRYPPSELLDLRAMFASQRRPPLNARLELCKTLARCVRNLHAVNWLHKALRADNVVFCIAAGSPSLSGPFLTGFELSRPTAMMNLTEKPHFEPLEDIYRHPGAQFGQSDGHYRATYDVYSLGIIMIEIALWSPIEVIAGFGGPSQMRPAMLREVPARILGQETATNSTLTEPCLPRVAAACGESFRDLVERCLVADDVDPGVAADDSAELIQGRISRHVISDFMTSLEAMLEHL